MPRRKDGRSKEVAVEGGVVEGKLKMTLTCGSFGVLFKHPIVSFFFFWVVLGVFSSSFLNACRIFLIKS